jgi:hypothetical protein
LVVNIHLMRAPAALRCCSQAVVSAVSCSILSMRRSRAEEWHDLVSGLPQCVLAAQCHASWLNIVEIEIGATAHAVASPPTPAEPVGERRHVTVMFCSLVDSTGIGTRLDRFDGGCGDVIRFGLDPDAPSSAFVKRLRCSKCGSVSALPTRPPQPAPARLRPTSPRCHLKRNAPSQNRILLPRTPSIRLSVPRPDVVPLQSRRE